MGWKIVGGGKFNRGEWEVKKRIGMVEKGEGQIDATCRRWSKCRQEFRLPLLRDVLQFRQPVHAVFWLKQIHANLCKFMREFQLGRINASVGSSAVPQNAGPLHSIWSWKSRVNWSVALRPPIWLTPLHEAKKHFISKVTSDRLLIFKTSNRITTDGKGLCGNCDRTIFNTVFNTLRY